MKRLLCTGGGTAGHVVPAIPVMEAFIERGVRVDFVGSGSDFERDLLSGLAVTYHPITSGKLRRYFSLKNVVDAFRVAWGICQAIVLVRRLAPDVVFSKGGFVSFPVVLAAWLWRIPIVAHESDLTPGLANRLAMPFVRTLCVNFPVSSSASSSGAPVSKPAHFSGELIYTGTPVRQALLQGDPQRGRSLLGLVAGQRLIIVTGGSLGADRINQVLRASLDELLKRAAVVHVCGPGKASGLERAGFHEFEYVADGWGDLLAASDLVVSRAGANTLYELLCLNKPNLLIPLSREASRGDQIENAGWAEAEGFSRVIQEAALDSIHLLAVIDEILTEVAGGSGKIARFRPPDSVALITQAILHAQNQDL